MDNKIFNLESLENNDLYDYDDIEIQKGFQQKLRIPCKQNIRDEKIFDFDLIITISLIDKESFIKNDMLKKTGKFKLLKKFEDYIFLEAMDKWGEEPITDLNENIDSILKELKRKRLHFCGCQIDNIEIKYDKNKYSSFNFYKEKIIYNKYILAIYSAISIFLCALFLTGLVSFVIVSGDYQPFNGEFSEKEKQNITYLLSKNLNKNQINEILFLSKNIEYKTIESIINENKEKQTFSQINIYNEIKNEINEIKKLINRIRLMWYIIPALLCVWFCGFYLTFLLGHDQEKKKEIEKFKEYKKNNSVEYEELMKFYSGELKPKPQDQDKEIEYLKRDIKIKELESERGKYEPKNINPIEQLEENLKNERDGLIKTIDHEFEKKKIVLKKKKEKISEIEKRKDYSENEKKRLIDEIEREIYQYVDKG